MVDMRNSNELCECGDPRHMHVNRGLGANGEPICDKDGCDCTGFTTSMTTHYNNRGRRIRVRPDWQTTGTAQSVRVIVEDPADGSERHVEVVPFQNADYGCAYGVGVYHLDDKGAPVRGTVLRWDRGPGADPTVIQWRPPHCADDVCGSPCGHEQAG